MGCWQEEAVAIDFLIFAALVLTLLTASLVFVVGVWRASPSGGGTPIRGLLLTTGATLVMVMVAVALVYVVRDY